MNTLIHIQAPRRPGRRIAELDPFAPERDAEPRAGYGCVDWFVYQPPPADAPASRAPAAMPPDPQAEALRH
ncbi:MAG TPA: hypothetical protein VEH00_14770 [Steroidobacteraceae bacterium]|nr:hypothetical protein [Steroidobacteraceae bacterium]